VSEGRVRVRSLAVGGEGAHATELGAGDVAMLSGSGIELRHASRSELEDALSWRTGMVVFRDTPLLQAVAELNRYTTTRIVIVDPQLATLRIGGTFRTSNAEGFLRLLTQAFEIEATPQGNVVVLTRR
jgi:transmembrane sensor